ncbi:MAG: hypothetical protein JXQ81_13700 [Desulfuromonadales bacterium]|nr:hypothetical protein [Desulfuromonadales bacterium]MBN2793561.1 hypothetical protein [Desulfuromonadales bacterium]
MKKTPNRKVEKASPGGAWVFLLTVAVCYLVALVVAPERATGALTFSGRMLIKLLPVLAVVYCLMFLSNLLIKPRWVKQHVGQDSGWKGLAIAVIGGIFSMGPIYVWYEFLKDLHGKGMRTSLIASFLYARSVKPQLLPLMILYFGWLYALVLTFYLILFAIFNGWITERLSSPRS